MSALNETQLRYLTRIAQQMMDGATTDIHLALNKGGVRDFREERSLRPADLAEGDQALARALEERV